MQESTKGVADAFIFEGAGTEQDGGSNFFKGVDFDGDGLTLEVVSMEKFTPKDPEYGVKHTYGAGGKVTKENWFVKNGLLEEGQSFKYTFKLGEKYMTFDNSSVSFYFAFTRVNPKKGDKVFIKRDKESNTQVNWTVTKV
jgi:hypothetical protein